MEITYISCHQTKSLEQLFTLLSSSYEPYQYFSIVYPCLSVQYYNIVRDSTYPTNLNRFVLLQKSINLMPTQIQYYEREYKRETTNGTGCIFVQK